MIARLLALLVGLAGLVPAAPVRAQDALAPRVLVLPLEGKGPPSPARLAEVIVRVAGERGARPSLAETGLAETALLVGCDPALVPCLDAMAAALNVDHMVFGTVRRRGRSVIVELTVTARQQRPATVTVDIPARSDNATVDERVAKEVTRLLEAFDIEARTPPPPEPAPPAAAEPVATPLPPAPPPERPRSGRVPLWTWSMLAGGVVVAAAGGAVWGSGYLQQSDVDDAPTATAADLEDLRDLEDDTELRLRVGGAVAITGVVIAATATVLAVRAGRDQPERQASRRLRPTIAATPVPGGAALAVFGRF
jgi:hypothetical protein